ncbi:MAG: polysaccharide deacetylase family protein [Phycisphaerales bacterium]
MTVPRHAARPARNPMTFARRVRPLVDAVADAVGILSRLERRMRGGLTILTYHRVLPDGSARSYPLASLVTPESVFREQVQWLAGRTVLSTLRGALAARGSWGSEARPRVCITFDDGFADNQRFAAPVLDELGVRATFFIATAPVRDGGRLWFDAAARAWESGPGELTGAAERVLGRRDLGSSPTLDAWMRLLKSVPAEQRNATLGVLRIDGAPPDTDRMMTPAEVRLLTSAGHEIGSHTVTHPILTMESDAVINDELSRSRAELASWTGTDVAGFCFPNGDCDDRVVEAVRRAGYTYACVTAAGRNGADADVLRLRRIDMNPARVTDQRGRHSARALRAEITLFHGALR